MGHLVEAVFRIALTGRHMVLSVTESVEALLGYRPRDFVGSTVSLAERIHRHDANVADKLFSLATQEISGGLNVRIRHADGRIRCVRAYSTRETTADGDLILNLTLQDAKSLRPEMAAQNSSLNLRSVMESVDECVYFKDRNHVLIEANQNTRRALSVSGDQLRNLAGLTDYDLFPEEVADRYYDLEKQIFAGMPSAHEIQESVDKEGKKAWTEIRKYPVRDADGEIMGIFGIARVITDRILAEQTQRDSEEYLKESQRVAGLGSYVLDIRTGVWTRSDVLDEILGIGKNYENTVAGWTGLIHPDERAKISAHLADDVLGQCQPCSMEYRIIRQSDHAERWVHGLGRLEFDATGKPTVLRGTIQDITERKLAQERLHLAASVFAHASEGIVITDAGGAILDVNEAFTRSTGYTRDEVLDAIRDC